jgi:hypothetical protein
MKVTSNHPFTKPQLTALNKELKKISPAVVAMSGKGFPSLPNYSDITIEHSPYMLDVFLSFYDITNPDYPKSHTYKIDAFGKVDYNPKLNMKFDGLNERLQFFGSLQKIEFTVHD